MAGEAIDLVDQLGTDDVGRPLFKVVPCELVEAGVGDATDSEGIAWGRCIVVNVRPTELPGDGPIRLAFSLETTFDLFLSLRRLLARELDAGAETREPRRPKPVI
jgi:hypothetical protein